VRGTAGPDTPAHTFDTTQETLDPMAPERTAAAVHQERADPTPTSPGDRASTALVWLLHRAEAWRDRLVGTGDAVDPTEDVEDVADARGLVLRPALLGFVAVLAVAIGASMPSSPFKLEMHGFWFFGEPLSTTPSRWGVYFSLAAVYGGLFLFMRVWWGMARLYRRRHGVPVKTMMGVFTLWSLPVLVIAPLFSRDAYSYAAQGEMVSHHMNPYLYGPFELGNNSYTAPVDPLWGNAPAPYGPMFLQLDGLVARITFHN
jgi:hypothetical protein